MTESNWHNKKVAILGYGVEGQSSARFFSQRGADITIHEQKPANQLNQKKLQHDTQAGYTFLFEKDAFTNLESYDLVMRTPTLPPRHPAFKQVDPAKISSQTNLFLAKWRDQTVGISGTKGKGTVASLLHHLLQAGGQKTLLGGNIGVPLLDIIDDMTEDHVAVLELSSFQLWDVTTSPHVAILLMVSPEHLELHQSLDNYLVAKQNLLRYQHETDQAIVLTDYNLTRHLANLMPAQQWRISSGWVEQGAKIDGSRAEIHTNQHFEFSINQTNLRGTHNTANAAAAVVAASLLGVTDEVIGQALSDYQPLPHRLQLVATTNAVSFYDDSIATTPEAAIAAVQSFDDPLVVLLGGINKQVDWSSLAKAIDEAPYIKGCVLMGEEAPRIRQALETAHVDVPILESPPSLGEAIEWSVQTLAGRQQGVVLLSPGAKSFDQYQDYKQRGQKFQQAVNSFLTR